MKIPEGDDAALVAASMMATILLRPSPTSLEAQLRERQVFDVGVAVFGELERRAASASSVVDCGTTMDGETIAKLKLLRIGEILDKFWQDPHEVRRRVHCVLKGEAE